jgi:hypothetical protein
MSNPTLCACGCGQPVGPGKRYVQFHYNNPNVAKAAVASVHPIAVVEDDPAPVPSQMRRGHVSEEFLFSYNNVLLQFAVGLVTVDGPLYQFLTDNALPVLWEQ